MKVKNCNIIITLPWYYHVSQLSVMEYANDEWCRCRPKWFSTYLFWFELAPPQKVSDNLSHCALPPGDTGNDELSNPPKAAQWAIIADADNDGLLPLAPKTIEYVCENFLLAIALHWPTVCDGIALCAPLWRQWRQWTTTTMRWESSYSLVGVIANAYADVGADAAEASGHWTNTVGRTHTHTPRDRDSCGRRWRPAKSSSKNKRQLKKNMCVYVCVCATNSANFFFDVDADVSGWYDVKSSRSPLIVVWLRNRNHFGLIQQIHANRHTCLR